MRKRLRRCVPSPCRVKEIPIIPRCKTDIRKEKKHASQRSQFQFPFVPFLILPLIPLVLLLVPLILFFRILAVVRKLIYEGTEQSFHQQQDKPPLFRSRKGIRLLHASPGQSACRVRPHCRRPAAALLLRPPS